MLRDITEELLVMLANGVLHVQCTYVYLLYIYLAV